jgi:hypothetical protein
MPTHPYDDHLLMNDMYHITVSSHGSAYQTVVQGLTGFCRTAASSMNVIFGRREAALTNLTYLLDSYILPNTFYNEGENGECGETPPAASSAIQVRTND